MKNNKFALFFVGALFCACSTVDQFEGETNAEEVVTINISNTPLVIGSDDFSGTTRGVVEDVDRTYKFFFEHNDSLGIFPKGGYQIPFVSPLAEGVKQEEITIEAKGWNTKVGENYVAYYPFVYDYRNAREIPFSYLGQKQNSVTDLSNFSKYSFRFSAQQQSTTGVFNFNLKDLGATIAIRLAAPTGTENTTWHKAILETGIENAFALRGTVDLFSADVQFGEVSPIIQSSSIAVSLNEFKAGSDGYIWIYIKAPETVIPVGKDLKVWLYDTEGNAYTYTRKTTSQITFTRGAVFKYAFDLDSQTPIETGTNTSVANLNGTLLDMVSDGTAVKAITVADNIPVVDAISIPSSVAQSGVSEVNITFENPVATSDANTSNTIVISDNSAANAPVQTESLSTINLTFAPNANAANDEIPSLDINLPSSTVTLDRTSGAVLFNVVTTKTALNTLIVKKGITINTLIVEGGNVIIENGATVGEVINKAPGQSTIVNWNDGGSTEGEVNAEISGFQSGN